MPDRQPGRNGQDGIVWSEARARLAAMGQAPALRALAGEGPLFEALLDERTRTLAEPEGGADIEGRQAVLTMVGQAGRWALDLMAVARVEPLRHCTPIPGLARPIMGLIPMAGDRYILVDADAVAAGALAARPRPLDRPGHAVALRGGKVALAVEHVEGIRHVVLPTRQAGQLVQGLLDGGLVLLDCAALLPRVLGRGEME